MHRERQNTGISSSFFLSGIQILSFNSCNSFASRVFLFTLASQGTLPLFAFSGSTKNHFFLYWLCQYLSSISFFNRFWSMEKCGITPQTWLNNYKFPFRYFSWLIPILELNFQFRHAHWLKDKEIFPIYWSIFY